jgi:hypothetical protein
MAAAAVVDTVVLYTMQAAVADLGSYKEALGIGANTSLHTALFGRPTELHKALTALPGTRTSAQAKAFTFLLLLLPL